MDGRSHNETRQIVAIKMIGAYELPVPADENDNDISNLLGNPIPKHPTRPVVPLSRCPVASPADVPRRPRVVRGRHLGDPSGDCPPEHITRYYGSFVRGWRLWIVMEYLAGGSCLDLVRGLAESFCVPRG
jgi:serine/threonine protein kinase